VIVLPKVRRAIAAELFPALVAEGGGDCGCAPGLADVVAGVIDGELMAVGSLVAEGAGDWEDCVLILLDEAACVVPGLGMATVPGEEVFPCVVFAIRNVVSAMERKALGPAGLPWEFGCEVGEDDDPADVVAAADVTFAVSVAAALAPSIVVTTSCKLCEPLPACVAGNCRSKVPLGNIGPTVCIC